MFVVAVLVVACVVGAAMTSIVVRDALSVVLLVVAGREVDV